MIEIFYQQSKMKVADSLAGIDRDTSGILHIRVIDYTEKELEEVSKHFDLDLVAFQSREDIELSSHYIESPDQLSLSFSVPSYSPQISLNEKDIHIIIKNDVTFVFIPPGVDEMVNLLTQFRYDFENTKFNSHREFLIFQLGVIADYYADTVELVSKRIKDLFYDAINTTQHTKKDLGLLTQTNFNNFLLRESVSEFQRIILLLRKRFADQEEISKKLSMEIADLSVISEHIQYNFDRINDLKANVSSKIELEQNRIFKILTIITISISLPALIAGIYGMNFKNMPELEWQYGYPVVLLIILLSFVLPLIYFKGKKWF